MRMTYFAYSFTKKDSLKQVYTFNLVLFLQDLARNFKDYKRDHFKTQNDEVFLVKTDYKDVYFFTITRNNQNFDKINIDSLEMADASQDYKINEKIIFSSFIFITEKVICFSSSFNAPRPDMLKSFIDRILKILKIDDYEFKLVALTNKANAENVKKLNISAELGVKISRENKCHEVIRNAFKRNGKDAFIDIGDIEIKFKPLSRKNNTKPFVNDILENIDTNGIKEFYVSGKNNLSESLIDYYLIGSGQIFSDIKGKKREDKLSRIHEYYLSNNHVQLGIEEYETSDRAKILKDSSFINKFHSWRNSFDLFTDK